MPAPDMNQQPGSVHHGHDQGLALTLAVLLLTGGVLLMSSWMGPCTTFTTVAVLVARRLALRRLLRTLPDA
ncbi:hypothetical protein [Streptomyces sp. NPDC005784]|uniref:hypothetical protein n=1 Tax=Streptomyces sp. NPDC005784 TaxID=3364731 RepID=UPI0036C11298